MQVNTIAFYNIKILISENLGKIFEIWVMCLILILGKGYEIELKKQYKFKFNAYYNYTV